jgi:hypothetical protein
VARLRRQAEIQRASIDQLQQRLDDAQRALERQPAPASAPEPVPPPPWADELIAAAESVDAAGVALRRMRASIADPSPRAPVPPPPAKRKTSPRRRAPVEVPGGLSMRDRDAVAAALRTSDVRLAVDGYNVTLGAWPELTLAEQRERLLDVQEELGARFVLHPTVFFDGAHDITPSGTPRRFVRVQFSPAD